MTVQIVRFTATEGAVAEVEAAIASMMAAIEAAAPPGVRYAATKEADGCSFLLLLDLDEGVENPLPAIAEARAFQQQLATWAGAAPTPRTLTVLGSYGLLSPSTGRS